MGRLFQNVMWPAAAGNVAWAFFTVIATEGTSGDSCAKLVTLFFLAIYLGADWMDRESMLTSNLLQSYYWIPDVFLAPAIVAFAIAAEGNLPMAKWALAAVFVAALFGHISGLWKPLTKDVPYRRGSLIAMNLLGLIILVGGLYTGFSVWAPPVAVTFTVVLYLLILWKQNPQNSGDIRES
jgi:hypothetical protein